MSPILFITICYFSIHLFLLLSPSLECKLHEDRKHTHISLIILFLTPRANSNKIGSQSTGEQVAPDSAEQRSWSLRQQHRKLRRNPTCPAEFRRGSGIGRANNSGSGGGHRKVSWKALRSTWTRSLPIPLRKGLKFPCRRLVIIFSLVHFVFGVCAPPPLF